jgi:hypothetical protein
MSDLSDLRGWVRSLVGDVSGSSWGNTDLDNCIRLALNRYCEAVEPVLTRVIELVGGGVFGLSLENWGSPQIEEVAYLHWPASTSVGGTTTENKIIDWWYYKYGFSDITGSLETVKIDVQIDGDTLPANGDDILVTAVVKPQLDGLDSASYTSINDTAFPVIALGASAYAFRAKESQINVASSIATYPSAIHVGVMRELALDAMREFELALEQERKKRLERPPWGLAERKRMRRLANER